MDIVVEDGLQLLSYVQTDAVFPDIGLYCISVLNNLFYRKSKNYELITLWIIMQDITNRINELLFNTVLLHNPL
jgi:hypothetical protein